MRFGSLLTTACGKAAWLAMGTLMVAGIVAGVALPVAATIYFLPADADPPTRIPSLVAWTDVTVALASGGNAVRGAQIGQRCNVCHGQEGFSPNASTPNLAAADRLYLWKQLEDLRSGKRLSPVMQAQVKVLSAEDEADLAAYYSGLPSAADPQDSRVFPQSPPNRERSRLAARLVTLGDGSRGIPPCQSCHGPAGHLTAAPVLFTQNGTYILAQLEAFAAGQRSNDINMPMRIVARQMSAQERQAVADYYGAGMGELPAAVVLPSNPDGK